jgi:hypothetical protein
MRRSHSIVLTKIVGYEFVRLNKTDAVSLIDIQIRDG